MENRGRIKEETWRLGDYPEGKKRGPGAGQEEETAGWGGRRRHRDARRSGDGWVGGATGRRALCDFILWEPGPERLKEKLITGTNRDPFVF